MTTVLTEFIDILTGGLTEMATAIGSGLNSAVSAMFLKTNSTTGAVEGLSTFGGVIAVFAGISLAVGLTTLVFHFIKGM